MGDGRGNERLFHRRDAEDSQRRAELKKQEGKNALHDFLRFSGSFFPL
jgi:hypothetical protein